MVCDDCCPAASCARADRKLRAQLAGPLQDVPERWWYMPHVNDAEKQQCTAYESKKHLTVRSWPLSPLWGCMHSSLITGAPMQHFMRDPVNLPLAHLLCDVCKACRPRQSCNLPTLPAWHGQV